MCRERQLTLFKWDCALVSIVLLLLSSCVWMKPVDTRVTEAREQVSDKYIQQIDAHEAGHPGEDLNISWNEALEQMFLSNPQLIRADFTLDDAKQRQKQVWKNMIPSLSANLSDTQTIENLGDLFSDSNFRISSFISLGDLLELPSTVYANRLTYMGAALTAENTMRQQVIALYRLFQEQRLLNLEWKALELEGEIIKGFHKVQDSEMLANRLLHEEAVIKYEEKVKSWKTNVGDFFMTGYSEINLESVSLPDIRYNPDELDFRDTSRWGLLQLNLLALENIAEEGRVLETYFRYLPRANLSVSAPPLFSNNSSTSFDAADIRLNPSFTWTLDSRGSIGQQLARLKRNKPLDEWQKDKRKREEVAKLFEGKEALIEINQELKKIEQSRALYRKAVRTGLVKDPQKALRAMRGLKEKEVRLLAREIEISTSFWLIDEQRWRKITKRWLQTRPKRSSLRKAKNKNGFKTHYKNWLGRKPKNNKASS